MFGIKNLSSGVFKSPCFPVDGRIFGAHERLMICLACRGYGRNGSSVKNIWFLVDTGSPFTYLEPKSITALFGNVEMVGPCYDVVIQDETRGLIECRASKNHFADVNVLGMNAIRQLHITIEAMNCETKERTEMG